MKKSIISIACALMFTTGIANAVPWCHQGTIVQIADVSWNQSQILANFTGSIPTGVTDPEHYITFTATHNYANTFAGGGGGFGGYSVPGSGQVKVEAYAPYSYTNMVGPGNYFTSQGVQFKLKKCYTIPPMTIQHEFVALDDISGDDLTGGDGVIKPYVELEAINKYWEKVPARPTITEQAPARANIRR